MIQDTLIWIHCSMCGEQFSLKERDYTHGRACGKC
jgi:hypothetical protein